MLNQYIPTLRKIYLVRKIVSIHRYNCESYNILLICVRWYVLYNYLVEYYKSPYLHTYAIYTYILIEIFFEKAYLTRG